MRNLMALALVTGAFALVTGCDSGKGSCDSAGNCDTSGNNESGGGDDTNGGNFSKSDVSVQWTDDAHNGSVDVSLSNLPSGVQGFWFGMAETASGSQGWYGEDCYHGTGSYQYCHYFSGSSGSLDYVDDPDQVVESSTTLFDGVLAFDDSGNSRLTYFLQLDYGDSTDHGCYTWGDDTSYYSGACGDVTAW